MSMTFESGTPGDFGLAVKTKGPIVGKAEWRTGLSWEEIGAPHDVVTSDLTLLDATASPDGPGLADMATDTGIKKGTESGGCHTSKGTGAMPLIAFLLVLLALLRYHGALCREAQ